MTLNDAYALYHDHPSADTLNSLFAAVTLYAARMASLNVDYADRDDAAQEAVVQVWTRLDKFDCSRGKFAPWAQAKVLSSFADYRRRGRAQKRGAGWQHVNLTDCEL